jgi:hypothetical protein
MSYEPKPIEQLMLWWLAISSGTGWQKDCKPQIKKSDRERLMKAGFIDVDRVKQAYRLTLTDAGWNHLAEHTTASITSGGRPNLVPVLSGFLAQLDRYLSANNLSLADFFRPQPQPIPATDSSVEPQRNGAPATPTDLPQRILDAYHRLSGGRGNVRVRLADLRDALADVPRPALDDALLQLATRGQAALYRLDNPLEISSRDREAVLMTPAGDPRHLIYLGGHGS